MDVKIRITVAALAAGLLLGGVAAVAAETTDGDSLKSAPFMHGREMCDHKPGIDLNSEFYWKCNSSIRAFGGFAAQ